jgi:hypothetical protein
LGRSLAEKAKGSTQRRKGVQQGAKKAWRKPQALLTQRRRDAEKKQKKLFLRVSASLRSKIFFSALRLDPFLCTFALKGFGLKNNQQEKTP